MEQYTVLLQVGNVSANFSTRGATSCSTAFALNLETQQTTLSLT